MDAHTVRIDFQACHHWRTRRLWALLCLLAQGLWPLPVQAASRKAPGLGGFEDRAYVDSLGRIHLGSRLFAKTSEVVNTCDGSNPEARCCQQGWNITASYAGVERTVRLPRSVPEHDFAAVPCSVAFASANGYVRSSLSGHVFLYCSSGLELTAEQHCGCAPGNVRITAPVDPRIVSSCSCGRADVQTTQVRVDTPVRDGFSVSRHCADIFPGSTRSYDIFCIDGVLQALWDTCVEEDPPPAPSPLEEKERRRPRRLTSEASIDTLLAELEDVPCDNPPQDQWWPSICASVSDSVVYTTVAGGALPGSEDDQLNQPHGIYVSPVTGDVYISDWKNHRVQRWTAAAFALGGGVTTMAGVNGQIGVTSDVDLLWNPADIVVAGRSGECGDLFIADESNNRVLRWPQGSSIGQIIAGGRGGPDNDQLNHPTGIHVTDDLTLYIADRFNHRVVVWVKTTDVLEWNYDRMAAGIGIRGNSLNRLDFPSDVALDSLENVYVADFGNDRIMLWEPGASEGIKIGDCLAPFSTFVDNDDRIYAACSTHHCIRRWEYYGADTWIQTSIAGSCGFFYSAPHKDDDAYDLSLSRFFSPQGVFVSNEGDIYVSDTANARVMKRTRDALTMWAVTNSAERYTDLLYWSVQFYIDVTCSTKATIRGYVTVDGPLSEPWTPQCVQQGFCQAEEAWIGRYFWGPKAIRCVRLITNFTDTNNEGLSISVQYWTGQQFQTLYDFGQLASGEEALLRPPRFDSIQPVCLLGQRSCTLTGIVGDWQADGDRIQVKAGNCESGSIVDGFPYDGISARSTDGGTTFQIGDDTTQILADASEGADYLLCWCDNRQKACEATGDFSLHIANLSVHGPSQAQSKVSTLGTPLVIEDVEGVELNSGDQMTVVSGQCGEGANPVFGIPELFSQPSPDGRDYYWGPDLVSSIPGVYTLCWCRPVIIDANTTEGCGDLADYGANAGNLLVAGPNPGQNFECTKGDVCVPALRGVQFSVNDSLMVLDRCGQGSPVEGFPAAFALGTAAGSSSEYTWGNEGIDPVVGLYYVCWCSRDAACTQPADFLTEVGVLTVLGPSVAGVLQCYVGRDCVVSGIEGIDLATTSSRLLVTNRTCGDANIDNSTRNFPGDPDMPLPGISFVATNDGTSFRFGYIGSRLADGDVAPVQPDFYTVCWCHVDLLCNSSADYRVQLGELRVNGPFIRQKAICGSGTDCEYDFDGVGLSLSDTLVIKVDNCSYPILPVQQGDSNVERPSNAQTSDGDTAAHVWIEAQMPVDGGRYVVCWCGDDNCESDTQAYSGHNVLVGTIDVPDPFFNDGAVCEGGKNCTVSLRGFGLSIFDRVAVMDGDGFDPEEDACGYDSFLAGVPNDGVSFAALGPNFSAWEDIPWELAYYAFGGPMIAVGGVYPLCWCAVNCISPSDFVFRVGRLKVLTPTGDTAMTCQQGLACEINSLPGLEGSVQDGDLIRIATSCNPPAEDPVAGIPNSGLSYPAIDGGRTFSWGTDRVTAIVGTYAMCWCSVDVGCDTISQFLTEIGSMLIAGPDTGASQECFLGVACVLEQIRGQDLHEGDSIIISVSCRAETALDGTPRNGYIGVDVCGSVPGPDGVTQLNTCLTFKAEGGTFINAAVPGMYRMCWCSAEGVCDPDVADDFHTDVGLFVSRGPLPDQEFWCIPGFPCSLTGINGVALEDGDKYFVPTGACGTQVYVDGFPDQGKSADATEDGSAVAWALSLGRTTPPASYQLCWCPSSLSCAGGSQFNAAAGTLQIAGPNPGQFRECSVSNECSLNDIEGHGLSNMDRALVIEGDDCGVQPIRIPAGFPGGGLSADAENSGRNYPFGILRSVITRNYTMCWCANSRRADFDSFNCTTDDGEAIGGDFIINFGKVFVPEAPAPNTTRTCISGQPCAVENLLGAQNNRLTDNATILIISKDEPLGNCPETPEQASTRAAQGWPNSAISNGATQIGTYYTWSDASGDIITAQGGIYSMCWKPQEASVYAYFFGVMTVVGPDGNFTKVCTKTADCSLQGIQGEQLQAGDFLRVMTRCGESSLFGVQATNMSSPSTAVWRDVDFQGTPGLGYFICWCSGQNGNTCALNSDYATKVGEITIQGPTPGQNRACDRGKACTINRISGIALEVNDSVQILVECGTGPKVEEVGRPGVEDVESVAKAIQIPGVDADSEFTYTWNYLQSRPGIYRMCWCASAEEEEKPGACGALEGFDVEVGIITIQGPEDMERQLVPYDSAWELTLAGVNLQLSPNARLRILKSCAEETVQDFTTGRPAVPGLPLDQQPVGYPVANSSGNQFVFSLEAIQRLIPQDDSDPESTDIGVPYRLCWCRGPTAADPGGNETGECGGFDGDYSDFNLDLGEVYIECAPGSYPVNGTCALCANAEYKDLQANQGCLRCPDVQHITTAVGSTAEALCFCRPGYYWASSGLCQVCPEGFYCPGVEGGDTNIRCPENSQTWAHLLALTETGLATKVTDCQCIAGYEPSLNGPCVPCEMETAKAVDGNSSCLPCTIPLRSSTIDVGSTECVCTAGLYLLPGATAQGDVCAECPRGSFCPGATDVNPTADFYRCSDLYPFETTEEAGATSEADCACEPGYYRPENGLARPTCVVCGYESSADRDGTYKPVVGDARALCRNATCPENSEISQDLAVIPRDEANCLCISDPILGNFEEFVNQTTGRLTCVPAEENTEITSVAQVPAFNGGFVFYNVPVELADDPLLIQVFLSELGLNSNESSRVQIVGRDFVANPEDLNGTNGTTQAAARRLLSYYHGPQAGPSVAEGPTLALTYAFDPTWDEEPVLLGATPQPGYLDPDAEIWDEDAESRWLQVEVSNDTTNTTEENNATGVNDTANVTDPDDGEVTTTTTTSTTTTQQLGTLTVTIRIWQSTYLQALALSQQFNTISTSVVNSSISQAAAAYSTITLVEIINQGISFQAINCHEFHPNTFVVEGEIFISPDVSCVCGLGYAHNSSVSPGGAWFQAKQVGAENPATSFSPAKCWPCPQGLGGEFGGLPDDANLKAAAEALLAAGVNLSGFYKAELGDHDCTPCAARFPVTEPTRAAWDESNCTCQNGWYRETATDTADPELVKNEQCIECEKGEDVYCTGNRVRIACPMNEGTDIFETDTSYKGPFYQIDNCECKAGYFREIIVNNTGGRLQCLPCETGYYKEEVQDGIGRCVERCALQWGFLSTSDAASTSADDCYCQPGSYLPQDEQYDQKCRRCPSEGVWCAGGFDASASINGTDRVHAQPQGMPGFFMISASLVKECRIDQGSVCLGGPFGVPSCAEGHQGVLCGECSPGWRRDRFPLRCEPCTEMSGTAGLIFEMMWYFTVQALYYEFLAFASLAKTETQKNVLVVMLRMFQHWCIQVTTMLQFDLAEIKPMMSSDAQEVVATTNDTATDGASFPWPNWQQTAFDRILWVQNIFEGTTSLQNIVECIVDGNMKGWGSEAHTYVKLIAPASFWLCYPVLMVGWVILCAYIQGKILFPLWRLLSACYHDGVVPTMKRKWNDFKTAMSADSRRPRRYGSRMSSLEDLSPTAITNARRGSQQSRGSRLTMASKATTTRGSVASFPSSRSQSKSKKSGRDFDSARGTITKMTKKSMSHLSNPWDEEDEEDVEVETNYEEDWYSDDDYEEEEIPGKKRKKRVAGAVYTPQMLQLADDIDANVMHPKRFSYGYILKDHEENAPSRGERVRKVDYGQCVLHLFRKRPNLRQLLTDITPWMIIALNDSWFKVTNRMLQLLYCEAVPEPTGEFRSRFTADSSVVCYTTSGTHFQLMLIAFFGLLIWSSGIILVLYFLIQSHDLQSSYVQRNFGYLIEGYEPQTWGWELTVKKADLLTTSLITYTSVAPDTRAKLLLYSMQSFIALAVQLSAGPFDDRQLRLLDRMETTGLIVRNVLFTGIAIALLFDLSTSLVLFIALVITISVLIFLVRLVFHSIDDFVGTKVVMVHEQRMRLAHDMEEKRRVRVLDGVHPNDVVDDKADEIRMRSLSYQERLVKWLYNSVFYGEWRRHQLLHLEWSGPGSDAQVYMPKLYDGYPVVRRTSIRTASLKTVQFIFNLKQDFQLSVLKNLLEDFVNLLIQLAKFRQLPAQLTDMIFFLARAVKLMKKSMMEHPNTKRVIDNRPVFTQPNADMFSQQPPPPADDENQRRHRHAENLSDLDRLKTAMLEELFDRLLEGTKRKAELIETMRAKFAGVEVIQKESFPMQAAWDIMDKLTNDQLQQAASCPVHLYKRVKFNLSMSRCSIDLRDAMHIVKGEQKKVKERRKEIYTFISFALRRRLEAIPDVDWAAVRQVLDMLPVEELERLGKEPELCIQQVLESRVQEKILQEFRGDNEDFLTVEDINGMLMYIQKLPYNELHLLIEYTQLLLDYLTLPTNATWREEVAARGEREHAAPDFYHSILRLKRQLRDEVEEEEAEEEAEEEERPALGDGRRTSRDVVLTLDTPKQEIAPALPRGKQPDPLLTVPVVDNEGDDDSSLESMDSLVQNMLGIEDEEDDDEYEDEEESIVGELIGQGMALGHEEDEEDEEEMEEDVTVSPTPSDIVSPPAITDADGADAGYSDRLEALRRRAGAGAFDDWEDIAPGSEPGTSSQLSSNPRSASGKLGRDMRHDASRRSSSGGDSMNPRSSDGRSGRQQSHRGVRSSAASSRSGRDFK